MAKGTASITFKQTLDDGVDVDVSSVGHAGRTIQEKERVLKAQEGKNVSTGL